MKAAIFIENEFEDMELMYPVMRLEEAGYDVDILGLRSYTRIWCMPLKKKRPF